MNVWMDGLICDDAFFAAQMGHFGQIHHGPTNFSEEFFFRRKTCQDFELSCKIVAS